jgi:hypothetical protein
LSDSAPEGGNPAPEASADARGGKDAGSSPMPQAHASPSSPEASGVPDPAAEASNGDQPLTRGRPVWEKVLDFPHVPPPIRWLAERRLNIAYVDEVQRSLSRRDSAENAATRLPPGEQARVPVIWLAEIFTPTTIDGLVDGMRALAGKAKGTLGFEDDLVEWILSSRRLGQTAWHNVPYVRPRGSRGLGSWFEDQMPPGIAHIHLSLHTLTSTVTVLTAAFRLQDDRARELEDILNQDLGTRVEMRPKRGFSPVRTAGDRGLDRDVCALAVRCLGGFVVEPYPALGEVTEVQCAASFDSHRGALNAVCPLLQWMGEGIPVVEITHHRYGPAGLIDWQCEGDANIALTPRLGCLDQLLSPLRR